MTKTPDINIVVDKFRAVEHADIAINGITVVAGENGSGKSSISKLLYFLYRNVAGYDNIVKSKLLYDLRDVAQLLDIMFQEYRSAETSDIKEGNRRYSLTLRKSLLESDHLEIEVYKWLEAINIVENYYKDSENNKINPIKQNRIYRILLDILKPKEHELNMTESFEALRIFVQEQFSLAQTNIRNRPTSIFIEELIELFSKEDLPQKFEVLEYGSPIVALDSEQLSIPYNIQNAIYIDSPMIFYGDGSNNEHWDDLLELMQKPSNENSNIANLINTEIIKGQVTADDSIYATEGYKFLRNDGQIFNLLDVATGIKSFSILQLLLKNGSINEKTLMIIDEPESHLHPQWIIEYARIVVLLNKHLGVKFFLATHNPDMVRAIRYISEKEGTLEKVNFYLAEQSDEKFKYNYKSLNIDIEPIFASFNIALERINQYGI